MHVRTQPCSQLALYSFGNVICVIRSLVDTKIAVQCTNVSFLGSKNSYLAWGVTRKQMTT